MKNMMKFLMLAISVLFLANMLAPAAMAATLDDVAKGVQQLQVGQARLESQVDGLRIIMTTLFVALFAAMSGLFYFVFDISRSLRIPKEERVEKLERMTEKMKDFLKEVSEKLHLPKPIL